MHRHVKPSNVLLASDADTLRLSLQMAEYQERVGRRIREAREAKGWSQPKLAHALGPTKKGQPRDASTISRYERGKVMPGSETLEAIADALEVDVAFFMASEPKPGTPDLMGALSDGESQLDRVEKKLDELLARVPEKLEDVVGRLVSRLLADATAGAAGAQSPGDSSQRSKKKPAAPRKPPSPGKQEAS